jgi:RHS repeat-associated protein
MSNTVAADNSNKYSRDPGGGLVGIGTTSGTGGVLALTDMHTDVVGDFSATGTTLAGSASYDPLGNVLSATNLAGHLGYQSGWTDPATKQVNMAARWYNPATGQFTSRDTVEQPAAPNSASFNPFAYGADSPMTSIDPSGHGWWSTIKSWGSAAWHGVVSVWHATTHFVSTYVVHPLVAAYNYAYDYTARKIATWRRQLEQSWDNFVKQYQVFQARLAHNAHIRALNAAIKRKAAAAGHTLRTAYHATAKAVTATTTFVQHHAAAIGSFVVSTAVFIGCEAVLGAATGGVGAVAGAVACGALSGAVGGLFNQGAKCVDGQKGACSAASFAKSALIGGVVGGVAGFGGAIGGKVLSSVGGRALGAIGGIFGRGSTEVGEGVAEGAAVDAASSTVDTAAETVGRSGAGDAAESAAPRGGEVPRGEKPSTRKPSEQPKAGDEPAGASDDIPISSAPGIKPLRPQELATGRRLLKSSFFRGRSLRQSDEMASDFTSNNGTTYDAIGGERAFAFWDRETFLNALDDHVLVRQGIGNARPGGHDYTVLDLTGASPSQVDTILDHIVQNYTPKQFDGIIPVSGG